MSILDCKKWKALFASRDNNACLNVKDLNDIEWDIAYLSYFFNKYYYPHQIKPRMKNNSPIFTGDWDKEDIPTTDDIGRICDNVITITQIRTKYFPNYESGSFSNVSQLNQYKNKDRRLTYGDINQIEIYLNLIKALLDRMQNCFTQASFRANRNLFLPKGVIK